MMIDKEIYQRLFSQKRLDSYADLKEHLDNFKLINSIAAKMGLIEIVLRNSIDYVVSINDNEWILKSLLNTKLAHHQALSQQSLGFWLRVVDFYKIHNQLFTNKFLKSLDFKRYFMGNKNKGLRDYQKVSLLLLLFKNLRNRAFHFENLYKLNNDNKPRLSASIQNKNKQKMIINLATENIEIFLDDILMGLVEKSLERIGEKDPLETKRIIAELNQGIK
ncbi:hypothetical protein LS74_003445 [Helicobacter magdeburgensis]|uniref:CAAX protease n=3 Tax=Helicobacter TaxID=209 RepID=A0A4U8T1E7_9HELI|nr:hypothetical protein [Helicobacter bilis]TLD93205.1 hypothetical protein LS74_003445 [Helicobacter magdeburgensis]TLE03188.1 hypothetical protein LS77_009030 [Helicobacter bilis]TLE04176.1 hypothetical protein LS76_008985 [Helicobacter bilis]